jgi:hypothetical protein
MNYLDRLEEAIKLTKAEAQKRAEKAKGRKKRAGDEEEEAISTLRTFSGATPEEREKAEKKRKIAARRRSRAAFVQGGREAQANLAAESYQQIGDILAETMQLAMADAGFDDDESTKANIQASTPQGRADRRKKGRGRNQGRRRGDAGRSQIR